MCISGISNYFFGGVGIEIPVVFGNALSITLGSKPFTSPRTLFIIFALNCSDETYLYVKKPPPNIPKTSTVVKIVKTSRTFLSMIKEQIARATALMSVVVLLLIVAISPLYVTMSIMTRQLQEKIK